MADFLYQRKQRVVLNGQYSSWAAIEAGVPKGFILGPLFFQIYTNDLSDELASNPKLFADDTSVFSMVENMTKSVNDLNNNLARISTSAFQWKMNFNPDTTNQVQDVIFSRKLQNTNQRCLIFIHNTVNLTKSQKHLRVGLDSRLDQYHPEIIFKKVNGTIGFLRKLQNLLPRKSLITVYKSFIGPHLGYDDIIFAQFDNASFHRKLESVQCNWL